ncbi:hypothetical protein [Endozoicomonas atrinae]|uniref:hypothetical protein n=1 Tax=Endozoicomonas atrinae TaxID=1333660 RepID=UPI003B006F8D
MELKGTTVSTDLFKLFAEKDGSRNGFTSLQHGNYQFKAFFSVPTTDSRSRMLEDFKFPVISGKLELSITGPELREHIRNKPSGYYTQAHLQHDNPLPIYLDSSSVVVEGGDQVLTDEMITVFDRIKRLEGRTITAEVIRYNPAKQTAIAWHQFSIGALHYGTHIATPIKKTSLQSQIPNSLKHCKIQITGKVRVDKHRLASSIHQDFHAYQYKFSSQSNGLPVYFLGHTVQLERMYNHRSHGY